MEQPLSFDQLIDLLAGEDGGQPLGLFEETERRARRDFAALIHTEHSWQKNYKAYLRLGGRPIPEMELRLHPATVAPQVVEAAAHHSPRPGVIKKPITRARITISDEELAAFYNLVLEKFGKPPSNHTIADYFGFSESASSNMVTRARMKGLITVDRNHGAHIDPEFERRVARVFGKYKYSDR